MTTFRVEYLLRKNKNTAHQKQNQRKSKEKKRKEIWHYIQQLQFSSVQLLSHVQLFVSPWTAARKASLSITNSQSPHVLMSIELVMPSNRLILCHPFSSCPQSFAASGSFQMSQLSASGGQSIGVSASASVLPMTIQDWFPLGWTGWISLQSKGLSRDEM